MADFKSTLQKYLNAEIALSEVEKALANTLEKHPKYATPIRQGLDKLATQGGISENDKALLVAVIMRSEFSESDPTGPRSLDKDQTRLPDPINNTFKASSIDDDQTRISASLDDDKTQISTLGNNHTVDDDSTRISTSQTPVVDDDQTRMAGDQKNATVSSFTYSSTASTTGWSKPFADGEEQIVTIGSVLKDRFRLLEFIGAGGMGDVYVAEDSIRVETDDIDTTVAIKVLNKEFRDHPESFRAMQREARKTMDLAHPNIVNVFTFDRDRANAFMVMELMRGDPLDKVIKRNPYGFSSEQVEHYVSGMGEALKYAHQKGVIHCDFKPSNVFLDQDTIKVFDFGIARAASNGPVKNKKDSFDAANLGAFTENYASIELIENAAHASAKDDIYALGCITYELLTGKHPFLINGKKTSAKNALDKGLKPKRVKKINRQQWQALQSALALRAEQRIPSVELFLNGFLQKNHATGFFSKWFAWPVITVVTAAAAYVPVTNWLTQTEIDAFTKKLKTLEAQDIAHEITQFEALDERLKDKYLSNQEVKNALLRYFKRSIQENASEHKYDETLRLQTQANRIFENSAESDIIELTIIEVEKERKIQLNQLNDQLNAILALPLEQLLHNTKVIDQWRATLNQLEPNSDKLQDQRLQIKFQDAIDALVRQQDFTTANALLDKAVSYFTNNSEFEKLALSVAQQQRNYQQGKHQAQLSAQLAHFLQEGISLSTLSDAQELVTNLKRLNSADANLNALDKQVKVLLAQRIGKLLADKQWPQALSEVESYQWALSRASKRALDSTINQAQQAQHSELQKLIIAIDIAAQAGKLTGRASTAELFAQLQATTTDSDVLEEALLGISQAWLKDIFKAKAANNWDLAEKLLVLAKQNLPVSEHPLLELQTQNLSLAKAQFTEQQATEQALLDEQQKTAEKEQQIAAQAIALQQQIAQETAELSQQFEKVIVQENLSLSTSRNALRLLDQISALDATQAIAQTGKERLLERYLNDANSHLTAKRLQSSLQLSREGLRIFPDEQQLVAQIAATEQIIKAQKDQLQQQKTSEQAQLEQQTDQLLIAIDEAAQAQRFSGQNSTELLFNELQTLNQSADILQEASAAITQGWLNAIFKARNSQQWEQAAQLISQAKKALPVDARASLQIEADKLAQSKQRFEAQAQAAEQLAIEQQKAAAIQEKLAAQAQQVAQQIQQLKQQFDDIVHQPTLSINTSRQALGLLEQIAALDSDELSIQNGRAQLIDKYLAGTKALRLSFELQKALKLSEDGLRIFPANLQLAQEKSLIAEEISKADRLQQDSEINQLLSSVEQLIDTSLAQVNSVSELDSLLDKLDSSGASEAQVKGVKNQAAIGYLNLSKTYTNERRFVEARSALISAKRFDSSLASLELQQAAIERSEQAYGEEQQSRKQLALINGVKQGFETQISANDIRKALISFKQLQKMLAADDSFIIKEGPAAIVGAYFRLTEQMVNRDRYTNAIKLLQGARKYAPDMSVIDKQQKRYESAKSIYLIKAATTNIKSNVLRKTKAQLDAIKADIEPKRWNSLNQALQKAVHSRIQQLQPRKPNSARQLLALALELFPNNHDIRALSSDTSTTQVAKDPETTKAEEQEPGAEQTTQSLFSQLENNIAQGAKSTAKLLKSKQDLNKVRSKLSKAQYSQLDKQIVTKITPLLERAVKDKNANAQLWLNKAKAYWPRESKLQKIAITKEQPKTAKVSTSGGIACTASLAGRGSKRSAVCYDSVNGTKTPYMIVVPSGGSGPFAISKFEIARQDYNLFCKTSGSCSGLSGNPKKPAVGISIGRMKQYAAWLSKTTGHKYRLPSSSQWVHAAKASGRKQPQNFNCRLKQGSKILKGKSIKDVFSGAGNSWGLVNYLGNAQEVVTSGGGYAALGGSYTVSMSKCSINLKSSAPNGGNKQTGFRVVRSL